MALRRSVHKGKTTGAMLIVLGPGRAMTRGSGWMSLLHRAMLDKMSLMFGLPGF